MRVHANAWLWNAVVLSALQLPFAAADGSETYVMTNIVSDVFHHGNVVLAETKQCHFLPGLPPQQQCYADGPNSFNSNLQNLSPFVGVAVQTAGDEFHLPVWCDNDVENPDSDASTLLWIAFGTGEDDVVEVCEASWLAGAMDAPTFADEAILSAPCDDCVTLGHVSAQTLMFTPEEDQARSDRIYWFVLLVIGVDLIDVGSLLDGFEEDRYVEITQDASRYVIDDPSGDDVLRNTAGVPQAVVDGVPVAMGDLSIVRSANGLLAKRWTITHEHGDGFAAALRDAGSDLVFDLSTAG